jgi:hypothetical protein
MSLQARRTKDVGGRGVGERGGEGSIGGLLEEKGRHFGRVPRGELESYARVISVPRAHRSRLLIDVPRRGSKPS